jgi:hypothetical protein
MPKRVLLHTSVDSAVLTNVLFSAGGGADTTREKVIDASSLDAAQ